MLTRANAVGFYFAKIKDMNLDYLTFFCFCFGSTMQFVICHDSYLRVWLQLGGLGVTAWVSLASLWTHIASEAWSYECLCTQYPNTHSKLPNTGSSGEFLSIVIMVEPMSHFCHHHGVRTLSIKRYVFWSLASPLPWYDSMGEGALYLWQRAGSAVVPDER